MKTYIKPAIVEIELFTKDAISLTIPKTVYKRSAASNNNFVTVDDALIAHSLAEGESLSGAVVGANL